MNINILTHNEWRNILMADIMTAPNQIDNKLKQTSPRLVLARQVTNK